MSFDISLTNELCIAYKNSFMQGLHKCCLQNTQLELTPSRDLTDLMQQ